MLRGRIFFALLFVTVSLSSRPASAEWQFFYQVEDGPKYYFDKDSIQSPQKGIVHVSVKTTLGKDSDEDAEQYKGSVEINCRSRSYRILGDEVGADEKNKELTTKTATGPSDLRRMPLESVMGVLWTNVCDNR